MTSVVDRFWAMVPERPAAPEACWEWRGSRKPNGYGQFRVGRQTRLAHRMSWVLTGSTFLPGEEIDHACSNRRCVRPEHLSAVPRYWNIAQGRGRYVANMLTRAECPKGHPLAGDNLYWIKPCGRAAQRRCRTCQRAYGRAQMRKWRAGQRLGFEDAQQ